MSDMENRVFRFGKGVVDGDEAMRDLLGGKGAGLAEMTRLSIPVPPGFTITTHTCRYWLDHGMHPAGLRQEIDTALTWLESAVGRRLSDYANPLLISVRSGAPVSMPGMMDTILNVGLNDECVEGLATNNNSCRFALDSYRRLIQMFGSVVLGIPRQKFEERLDVIRATYKAASDSDLSVSALEQVIFGYKLVVLSHTGRPFPQEPREQISMAIDAVFLSWCSERARCYRRLHDIPETLGTAVTVQAMVFGNRGEESGTGVGFTRNPSSGAREVFGEFLPNAQGEEIVAGTRTPMPIAELASKMPDVYRELVTTVEMLEKHYREVQDFEFTIEERKLYLLQTRTAKRAALAAVRTAVEMANEGLISRPDAVARVKPESLTEMLAPQLDFSFPHPEPLTQGIAASPGAAVGRLALSANKAVRMAVAGESVILVTKETTADDIHGMAAASGLLTARGGATSHAAVVARGMGKTCITGAHEIELDSKAARACIGGKSLQEGDWLSLDGSTGRVFEGRLMVRPHRVDNPHLQTLLQWAREASSCLVRTNADTPEDAVAARTARSAGIGLCRTEHMFFAPDRLHHMQAMILAASREDRIEELKVLLVMQQRDFEELFRVMSPLPVTIRLLDPPLHEFLPSREEIDSELIEARREEDWKRAIGLEEMRRRAAQLTETNPMLGHRGCRLSITYPEILQMQVRAILQAAVAVSNEGYSPAPEIMVPLVATEEEMTTLTQLIRETSEEVFTEYGIRTEFKIGTMIELPRAAVLAGRIARQLHFISFGTNDLTQMTYGFSRDDARSYLDGYLQKGILKTDPFVTIDQQGVGYLMDLAIGQVRAVNPKIKIGVCGEHGGDPESIRFFHALGVDYVSCSPSRLPLAQLAAGQAGLLQPRNAEAGTGADFLSRQRHEENSNSDISMARDGQSVELEVN